MKFNKWKKGTLSSLFNGGVELNYNFSPYNNYTGRYYLSIACDDVTGRMSVGSLYPPFSAAITSYVLNYRISDQLSTVNIIPTVAQAGATIQAKINSGSYATTASGATSANLNLSTGSNTISVQVTAPNGTTTKTYTVVVANGICTAGYYDDGTHLCVEAGVGYYSTGTDSNRTACSNKPSHSTYSSATATSTNCAWSCDATYVSDGTQCNFNANAALLSCNSDEIAVGLNGRAGAVIGALTLILHPLIFNAAPR